MAEIDLLGLFRQLIQAEAQRDSLEVGPAGSRLKIYGDLRDGEAFRAKIDTALSLRSYALEKLAKAEEGGA